MNSVRSPSDPETPTLSSGPPEEVQSTLATDLHVEATYRLTEALIASENRMRRRIEILSEAVFETDAAGLLVFLNSAWGKLTGTDSAAALGRPLVEFVAPIDRPILVGLLAQAESGQEHLYPQLRISHRNGSVIWAHLSVVRMSPGGCVGVLRDISREKAAQEELEKLSMVARSTQDMVIITDREGRTEWVNDSFVRRTGYTLSEVLGRKPGTLLQSPESDPTVISRIRWGLRQGRAVHEEIVNVTKDGTPYWVSIQINPIIGADGQIQRFIAVQRETTQRKLAEEISRRRNSELEDQVQTHQDELAARNREMEGLLRAIPDLVVRQRTDGTILHLQGEQCFAGATQHPFPIAGSATNSTADILAKALQCGRAALDQNAPVTEEVEIRQSRGVLHAELRSVPSGPEEFVLIARDITARRALEQENAGQLDREREISDMKSRFISVISHEFRTPMASILGSIEILDHHLERLSAEKRLELLGRVRASLHRMTDMLDDVLTLSRMDRRGEQLRPAEFNLRRTIQSVIDEARHLSARDHLIELPPLGEYLNFVTDPEMLRQILTNLLSNAFRFSPAGSMVRVSVEVDDARMTVHIEDHGIGIHPDDHARIFEPFERGRNVETIRGTGLGLNIVKRMVDALGGRVYVESQLQQGSRFSIELPRLKLSA